MQCVEGNSYTGTIQRYTVKEILGRINITVLSVAKGWSPGTTQRDTWSVLLERIYISVFSVAIELLKLQKYHKSLCEKVN